MRIEVFYVPGCPNHQPAVHRLKKLLRSESLNVPVEEIAVIDEAMARSLRFPGSPTVRVNGLDAEPTEQKSFGLACRLYSSGVPSEEALQRAIASAKSHKGDL